MNSTKEPTVHIVILNWNGREDTIECLESLRELGYENARVVVVDNASTDDSVREISNEFPGITILESAVNLGFAGGNNIGIRHAMERGTDYIWLLNNDTVVENGALTALINRAAEDSSIGLCGSTLLYYSQKETIQALGGGTYNKWFGISRHIGQGRSSNRQICTDDVENKMDYIVGASMLVSAEFVEEVGFLNEEYFLYYEELDWAVRGRDLFRLGYARDSIVYHKEGASIQANNLQKNSKSRLSDYYQIRNRLKFTWNYYPWMICSVYISMFIVILNRMWRGQWNRIPMILKLLVTFNNNEFHSEQAGRDYFGK